MIGYNGLGMLCAIMSGAMNAFGAILQKSAVNKIPIDQREVHFMPRLLRSPAWLLGLGMSMGLGTIFTLLSQKLIGPALVPGLSASGMIILAIGSVKLIGERIKPEEMLGIVMLILGIFFLGYSNLIIPSDEVDLLDRDLLLRIFIFTIGLSLCWLLSFLLAQRAQNQTRGLIMAVSGGFLYCLSNLWILPLIITIGMVFAGIARHIQVIIFIIASIMLVTTNLAGIRQVQEAYKFAPASKVQPIQQVPTQIVPILIYFIVFQRTAAGNVMILIPIGVIMIIVSGFLLGKRKVEL